MIKSKIQQQIFLVFQTEVDVIAFYLSVFNIFLYVQEQSAQNINFLQEKWYN